MGIFQQLKSCDQPIALKTLNEFLKYNAKFTETKTSLEFIKNCIESCHYPKLFYKSLRRNHVNPNRKTSKRYALNKIDTLNNDMTEIEVNIAHRRFAVDELPEDLKSQFMEYVTKITKERSNKKNIQLLKSLENQPVANKFPTEPKSSTFAVYSHGSSYIS
ncbi:unnamed protein product [Schistosoma haematobium]|nr:unnamed protein product [Schistosoma haematobium]